MTYRMSHVVEYLEYGQMCCKVRGHYYNHDIGQLCSVENFTTWTFTWGNGTSMLQIFSSMNVNFGGMCDVIELNDRRQRS